MKQFKVIGLAMISVFILGACSTSNEVVGGGIFQKRKHTGGVYWDRTEKVKASKEVEEEEFDIFRLEEESQKKYVTTTTIYNEDKVVASAENDAVYDAVVSEDVKEVSVEKSTTVATTSSNSNDSKSEISSEKKNAKKLTKKKSSSAPAGDVNTILLVILAIIIPPLAVFLYEGATGRFWIDLVLAILGWGVGFWLLGGIGWLCGLVAVIYALLIVLGVI